MVKLFEEFNFIKRKPKSDIDKEISEIEVIPSFGEWMEKNVGLKGFNHKIALKILNAKFGGKKISIKNFENGNQWKVEYVDAIVILRGDQCFFDFRFKEEGRNDHFLIPNLDDEITIYPTIRYYTKNDPYGEEDWSE